LGQAGKKERPSQGGRVERSSARMELKVPGWAGKLKLATDSTCAESNLLSTEEGRGKDRGKGPTLTWVPRVGPKNAKKGKARKAKKTLKP